MNTIKTWTTQELRDYIYVNSNSKTINQMTTIEYSIYRAAKRELRNAILFGGK